MYIATDSTMTVHALFISLSKSVYCLIRIPNLHGHTYSESGGRDNRVYAIYLNNKNIPTSQPRIN